MSSWKIAGSPMPGPDRMVYVEKATVGLRMDGAALRQGLEAMEWRYSVVLADEMVRLQDAYFASENNRVLVEWYDAYSGWKVGYWTMNEPVIGKRQTHNFLSVTIRFTPVYRFSSINPDDIVAWDGDTVLRFTPVGIAPLGIVGIHSIGRPTLYAGLVVNTTLRPVSIVGTHAIGSAEIG